MIFFGACGILHFETEKFRGGVMDKRIIYFSLKGCSQCEMFKPVFEKIMKELNITYELYVLPDAPFDVKKLVYKNNIQTYPTILMVEGENATKLEGAKPSVKLKEFLGV
jgi:thiol-disulfide isomerase/thioredoxin